MSSYYVEENQRSDPRYLPSTAREYEHNDAHYAKQPRGGQVEIRVVSVGLSQ